MESMSFMANVPVWLKSEPELKGDEYAVSCEVLVVGAGQCGAIATMRLAEAGTDVLCLEAQSWEHYNVYPTDMAVYNADIFLRKGTPPVDLLDVFNEYLNKSLGHAHPKLVRDYVFRSGEMFNWLEKNLPKEMVDEYAHPTNYRGNPGFKGEACGQKSFIGMVQWRDSKNNNMWGVVMKAFLKNAMEKGARFMFGCRGLKLLQKNDGTVTGCLAKDAGGKQFIINCKAVLVAAGDYGGNKDMQLDLSDYMRNLAWSYGLDRNDAKNVRAAGRDGSGIKMCLWAGGRMEAGPRAVQAPMMNKRRGFPFGGCFPCFGPDGNRFMNEATVRHGAVGICDMIPVGSIVVEITDSNWDHYLDCQGYGHETYDRSNDRWNEIIRADMAAYKTGPEGFKVHNFSMTGENCLDCFAADTVRELGGILGYEGEALDNFEKAVERYNEMCDAGRDEDWGCDPGFLFPIKKAPFFGVAWKNKKDIVRGGLCVHGGVCTDGNYNVVDADKNPIPGLFAAGNCCGQRYAVQYHTPTAGNSCGSALTTGYVAAECIEKYVKKMK